ncbi:hypothetical protein PTSG_12814 [Salpingoeca rosetta]|uniref:Uncharacterized protein n=1 Tax=Salpingoeca rosetta (strain ATCC 50818 / BSB-021) TaxID=946362 RepID=F2ULQ8_SALR5|nr:uncharacterized protein PTSG_12814 [Salpingoeca rosetta]EGD78057.1 hypothetical protein PTSG_12814 [Salpingoeca rosetta]|eukprot:XP_004989733.1 hypothetical protein PTSG_12814 [Salpingoeca rosetta]
MLMCRSTRVRHTRNQHCSRLPRLVQVAEPAAAAEDEDEDLLEDETPPVGLDSSLAKHDLQQLHKSMRSRGEDEDMDGMFQQLEAMATLEETEDAVIEEHRSAIQFAREMLTEEEKVLAEVEGVNSDSEEYARRLEQILAAKIEKLQHLKANVGKFRRQLQDEEARAKDCKGFKFV